MAPCVALTACASAPHIVAVQSAAIAPTNRGTSITIDAKEMLPFTISRERVEAAMVRAGFGQEGNIRYRLLLSAGSGSSRTGSFIPGAGKIPDIWVGRPDRSLAGRIFPGHMLRVSAVLVDSATNREVWRGSGTLRTADPASAAPQLLDRILARLPRS